MAVALSPKICKNIFFEKMDKRLFYSAMTIWGHISLNGVVTAITNTHP